jgi:serine/threonine protein kinase/tetratricopeptide (TPR) repeat protein
MEPWIVAEDGVASNAGQCNCRTPLPLVDGLCLNCLLRGTLENPEPIDGGESLDGMLADLKEQQTKWLLGDYEVIDEIGRGGMAVIYRARHIHSQQIVALKRVLAGRLQSKQDLARFRREAKTAAALVHRNIVPVYRVGEDNDGVPFFTMKLALRGSLLRARGELQNQTRRSVEILTKAALAIEYAHSRGVLHRDLKPANILIDEEGEPLVADFGLAKWQTDPSQMTQTLATLGTPGYLAPEQAVGSKAITAASDVYSLGAILFELIAGRLPFVGEYPLAVMHQASSTVAPKLRQFQRTVDRDLETICARCLEREPSDRYQSAGDLANDLTSWLNGRPILARSLKHAFRFPGWSRRNAIATGLISLCAMTVIAGAFWEARDWRIYNRAQRHTAAARSIGVLPILNLDTLTTDEAFSRSISNSLDNDFHSPGFTRVKSRQLDSPYSTTAEEIRKLSLSTNSHTLLTGTVRTVGGKTRICLRLLDGATGEPLLARILEQPDRSNSRNVDTAEITHQLKAILRTDYTSAKQPQIDPGLRNEIARDAIEAGRESMLRYTLGGSDRAVELFKKAIQITPESAIAHSYLAFAAATRTHYIADWSYLKLAREAAVKAIHLSPFSPEAHRALAGVYYQDGRFPEALEEALQALEVGAIEQRAAGFVGTIFTTLGHPDVALRWLTFASSIRKVPGEDEAPTGDCWVQLGDDDRAAAAYARSMELQPNRPQGAVGMCRLRILQGDFEKARTFYQSITSNNDDLGEEKAIAAQIEFFARDFEKADKLYGELARLDKDGGGSFYGAVSYQSAVGRSKQGKGDVKGGNEVLERCLITELAAIEQQPENSEVFYRLAAIEASLGKLDGSIEHLRTSVRLGWVDHRSLALDPRFDALHSEPAFESIINDLSARMADMRTKITN